jgi:N-acetylneuraminate synthase
MSREERVIRVVQIGGRFVGGNQPAFVIAEIGLNHGGSLDRALALVDGAARAGASAIKLQTLLPDSLVAPGAPGPMHVDAGSMSEFFSQFELDERSHRQIVLRARALGLAVLATPLSLDAVDLLERVGVDGYKIASGDITWEQLIRRCGQTRKPMVISTGMSSLPEVARALACARLSGASDVALLHCVSAYPVPEGSQNIRAIATLAEAFNVPIGLSDHGADTTAWPLAVVLGASIYERHIVLSSNDGSIDAAVSSDPTELAATIRAGARAADAAGAGVKVCLPAEAPNRTGSRRGLYARRDLAAGETITEHDVIALRPAIGLAVSREPELIGVTLTRDLEAGMAFLDSDLGRVMQVPNVA